MSALTPVACFDFDGTLCPGDSIVPYLRYCISHGLAPKRQLGTAAEAFFLQKIKQITPIEAKQRAFSFLVQVDPKELTLLGQSFVRDILLPHIPCEAITYLDSIKRAGYHIVVVSASLSVYMQYLPDILPVDDVLCTEISFASGFFLGPNCRDEEKVRRISAFLSNHPNLDASPALAAGDSYHDIPMLSMAKQTLLVNPDRRLQTAFPDAPIAPWSCK